MKTLKDLGIDENTLVVISSDNGPEVPTIVAMRRDHDHDGAHPWRGVKRDQWEGGHRVPFLIRWPGTVPAEGLGVTPFADRSHGDVCFDCRHPTPGRCSRR